MKHWIIFASVLFLLCANVYPQKEEAPTAEQVLSQMLTVYASCKSYADEGSVTDIYTTERKNWTDIRPFATAFVRPSSFYFEYQERFPYANPNDKWKKYMVWEDQDGSHSWWAITPQLLDHANLSLALGPAGGVSRMSSSNVPNLLREDLKQQGHRFQRISEWKLIGEETVEDKVAFKLEANEEFPNLKSTLQPVTIWVAKQNFLLLKIHRKFILQNNGPDCEVDSTTIYHPQINIEIPPERFKVTIPAQ